MSKNLQTIDGHVLLPHQANWNDMPNSDRLWRSSVDNALGGDEDRLSVRGSAWRQLRYQVESFNHIERARFDDRMREALKAGKIAVPWWGKGVPLAGDVEAESINIVLRRTDHGFAEGDYVFIQSTTPSQFELWDVKTVQSISGAQLVVDEPMDNSYGERTARVWPLLFGRPASEPYRIRNVSQGSYSVTVLFDQREVPPVAYDNFLSYDVGEAGTLNGGEGWSGAWVTGAFI